MTSSPVPLSPSLEAIDVVFGVVSLGASLPGILGNLFILQTFMRERQRLSRKIFILIALTDVTTSLCSGIPFGVSRLLGRASGLFSNGIFCNVSGLVFNITTRLSVFLISLLSFTRCFAIIRPMTQINTSLVLGSIGCYSAAQLIIAGIPFLNSAFTAPGSPHYFYYFDYHYTNCIWAVDMIVAPDTLLFRVAEYLLLFVPFFFPSLVVVASCCVCVVSLARAARRDPSISRAMPSAPSARRDSNTSKLSGLERLRSGSIGREKPHALKRGHNTSENALTSCKYRATRTITLVTLLFVILNFPYWVILLLFFIEQNTGLQIINYRNVYVQALFVFCTNVSPYLNAGLNPIIYFTRAEHARNRIGRLSSRAITTVTRFLAFANDDWARTSS